MALQFIIRRYRQLDISALSITDEKLFHNNKKIFVIEKITEYIVKISSLKNKNHDL